MHPLTFEQTVGLIHRLLQTGADFDSIVQQSTLYGFPITETIYLNSIDGVFYLTQRRIIQEHLDHQYVVYIDDEARFSRPSRSSAVWLAEKLCQLLVCGAGEIRVFNRLTSRNEVTWRMIRGSINEWIGGRP